MAGGLYIWIMGAFFGGAALVILLFAGLFGLGHWFDRKAGVRHGFLERPADSQTKDLPRQHPASGMATPADGDDAKA